MNTEGGLKRLLESVKVVSESIVYKVRGVCPSRRILLPLREHHPASSHDFALMTNALYGGTIFIGMGSFFASPCVSICPKRRANLSPIKCFLTYVAKRPTFFSRKRTAWQQLAEALGQLLGMNRHLGYCVTAGSSPPRLDAAAARSNSPTKLTENST